MNRECELKIELRLLRDLSTRNGIVSRREIEMKIERRLAELLGLSDLKKEVILDQNIFRHQNCFGFSARLLNILKANDIETPRDLVERWPLKHRQYRNLGKKSIAELELFLRQNNLI